jgi:hypothetical protein
MERLENMRNDKASYSLFCEVVLSVVVGKSYWKENHKTEKLSSFVTVSDEAIGLLLLENSWELWMEMSARLRDGQEIGRAKKQKHDESGKGLLTRYTENGGHVRKDQGWSDEGLKRFVELVKLVVANREEDSKKEDESFEKEFMSNCASKGGKRVRVQYEPVEVESETRGDDMYFD